MRRGFLHTVPSTSSLGDKYNRILVLYEPTENDFPYSDGWPVETGYNMDNNTGIRAYAETTLSEDVSTIDDSIWAYGNYYLHKVTKENDDSAIIRTDASDPGYQLEVFSTPNTIYHIERCWPGLILMSTDLGYYESVKAGKDFGLITDSPTNHKTFTWLGEQAVSAIRTDNKIYVSHDRARNWQFASDNPGTSDLTQISGTQYEVVVGGNENKIHSLNRYDNDGWTHWQTQTLKTGETVKQITSAGWWRPEFMIKTLIEEDPIIKQKAYRNYSHHPHKSIFPPSPSLHYYQHYDPVQPEPKISMGQINTPEGSTVVQIADTGALIDEKTNETITNDVIVVSTGIGSDFGQQIGTFGVRLPFFSLLGTRW